MFHFKIFVNRITVYIYFPDLLGLFSCNQTIFLCRRATLSNLPATVLYNQLATFFSDIIKNIRSHLNRHPNDSGPIPRWLLSFAIYIYIRCVILFFGLMCLFVCLYEHTLLLDYMELSKDSSDFLFRVRLDPN